MSRSSARTCGSASDRLRCSTSGCRFSERGFISNPLAISLTVGLSDELFSDWACCQETKIHITFGKETFCMPLLNIVLVLVVIGIVLWLINTYIPMAASIKKILNIVVVVVVILWLLRVFGILASGPAVRIN